MTTAMVIALGSGVATAAVTDERPTAAAPTSERPSATPPHVHGEPAPQAYRAPGAAAANRAPNTPKAPEVGPPFQQTSGVWQTNTLTPTLRNTVVDPDGNKTTSTFEVWTVKADGTAGSKVNLTDDNKYDVLVSGYVASGTPASVNIPKGKLNDGWTYMVRSSAYDGSAYETDWSPWAKFKITVPPVVVDPATGEEFSAEEKTKWQAIAAKALAADQEERDELAKLKAKPLPSDQTQRDKANLPLPNGGASGSREFYTAYTDQVTATPKGDCRVASTLDVCFQDFDVSYEIGFDTFLCDSDAAGITNKTCPKGMGYWAGFDHRIEKTTITETYPALKPPPNMVETLINALKADFVECGEGNASSCAWAGVTVLPFVGQFTKVTKVITALDAAVQTGIGFEKALAGLDALALSAKEYGALETMITSAARTSPALKSLVAEMTHVATVDQVIAKMPVSAQVILKDYARTGKLSVPMFFAKYWNTSKGWFDYPDFMGFVNGTQKAYIPKVGEQWDRFGAPTGGFLSPTGVPFAQRAIPPANLEFEAGKSSYHVYEWVRPWSDIAKYGKAGDIQAGKIAPFFEQPGGGTQYLLPKLTPVGGGKDYFINVQWLLDNKFLKVVPQA
uniref:TNT domain-containing protein n=1 Tax=Streptomyces sp. NBC_00003 TaxID=2903608 RepID=A0AAU2VCY5_9ACTN